MNANAPMTRQELIEVRRIIVQHRDQAERRARKPLTRSHKPRHRKKAEKSARRFGAMVHHLDIELKLLNDRQVVGIGGLPSDIVTDVKHLNP